MTDITVVDFLLENMMQLLNTNNLSILKAYEEKRIPKEQIEWVYVEMQFLQKFLKDLEEKRSEHEKMKVVVAAQIRDVAYQVEDTINSSVLINCVWEMADQMVDLLNFLHGCSKASIEHVSFIKRFKAETMEILSGLESHMAEKLPIPHVMDGFREEIMSTIKKVMETYDKEHILRWLECDMPDELHRLHKFSSELVSQAENFREFFGRATKSGRMFDAPSQCRLLARRSTEMFSMAEFLLYRFGVVIKDINPMKTQPMRIYEKELSATMLDPHMADQFCLLMSSFEKMVEQTNKIRQGFCSVINEIKPMITRLGKVFNIRYWTSSRFQSLLANNIRHGLSDIIEEINTIKTEVMEIYEKKMYGISDQQVEKSFNGASSKPTCCIVEEETIVGFHDEARTIMELLSEEHDKQLKVIPIVGMPGLGKTILSRKVYNDPFIVYHFHIRAWTYISQMYQKRDVLLSILSSAGIQVHHNVDSMSDEQLGEHFYKALKGKTYLVVMDDIWDIKAWDDLKRYFPNDNNGSRIMVTSRIVNVAMALHARPHYLRFLNEDESWDLLCLKAFRKESCPVNLLEIGKEIAKKCRGLPLAIVVISGLLAKKEKTEEWWRHVSESVSSYIISDPEQYMDALALSYTHLPHHLKPCFLYFGAFPEDYEILMKQLIWLWVAEGFIRQNERKSLEEVAESYLLDLSDRSLIIVSKKRSDGGIKACRVHDLLRDLCLRKAQEDNFLKQISRYEQSLYSFTNPIAYKQRRLCIHDNLLDFTSFNHYELYIRSFLSFGRSYELPKKDVSFVCQAFMLLRVLNLFSIKILFVPEELEQLVYLRYLALHVEQEDFKPSISNLLNLETIIIDGRKGSFFLYDIWKMVNLRHVYSTRPIQIDGVIPDGSPSVLDNLQTIGKLLGGHVLAWFPNLKNLKCQHDGLPKLDFLVHLETLSLIYNGYKRFFRLDMFPPNLKTLSLSNFRLPWDQMSILGILPNLEVLKLLYKAFEGPRWDTSDGEFRKLRFLKFRGLDIKQWNMSSNQFASLQTLVLEDCQLLEEIPSSLGDVSTLEMIQVRWCSSSTEYSARRIHEEQQVMGNDGLKVVIYTLNHNEVVFENVDEEDDE